jgi:hypothetical protein
MKTTVYIGDETMAALRQMARQQGRKQAELIREAVTAYVSAAPPPKPRGIGAYRSGRSDVSERAEEILREAAEKPR